MARGSITRKRRKNGSWAYRVRVEMGRDEKGKRQQPGHTHDRKRDAEAEKVELLHRRDTGFSQADRKLRLKDYLTTQWLPFYREQRKASSYLKREKDCRLHIIPALGQMRLGDLTPGHIQRFYTALATTRDPATVQGVAGSLSGALTQAVAWELIHRNPCRGAKTRPVTRRKPVVWTPEQFRTFLAAEDGPEWRCLWLTLALTGARKAEVLALCWDDVDWEAGTIRIERGLSNGGKGIGYILSPTPKTDRSRRIVSVPDALLTALREAQRRQEQRDNSAGRSRRGKDDALTPDTPDASKRLPVVSDNGLIFARDDGRPIAPSSVDRRWDRCIARAGVPRVKIHALRHGHATDGLAAGIPLKVISERLGHASIAITADTYSHVSRASDREAADLLGGLLLGGLVEDAAEA